MTKMFWNYKPLGKRKLNGLVNRYSPQGIAEAQVRREREDIESAERHAQWEIENEEMRQKAEAARRLLVEDANNLLDEAGFDPGKVDIDDWDLKVTLDLETFMSILRRAAWGES